jgi:hypothetical protein
LLLDPFMLLYLSSTCVILHLKLHSFLSVLCNYYYYYYYYYYCILLTVCTIYLGI